VLGSLVRASHEGSAAAAPPCFGVGIGIEIEMVMEGRWLRRPCACGAQGQRGRCPSKPLSVVAASRVRDEIDTEQVSWYSRDVERCLRNMVLVMLACVGAAYGGHVQAGTREPVPTNTITVLSHWPERGVEVRVSRPDIFGLRTGWTPFERLYPARGSVQLKAPEEAGGCSFHHWEIAKDKYLRTRTVRIVPSRDVQAKVFFLRAEGAASFTYRGTRRRDTVIAAGFDPPLSNLFASGKTLGFGIRGLGPDRTPLHGPFALASHGNGTLWMYNGAKERTAVIRCYPSYDWVVYIAYTNLPHEFELYTWMPDPTQSSAAAPHQQQQKDGCTQARRDDPHRDLRRGDPCACTQVTQRQDGPAQQR